jgi:hypothetical protein
MMSLSAATVSVLLLLLPGFLTAKLLQWLCVRPSLTEADKLIEAILYSFLVYAVYFAIFGDTVVTRLRLVVLCVLPLILAAAVAFAVNKDYVGAKMRTWGFTKRTALPSVWNDVLHRYGGYALVEMNDGRLVLGWVKFYSDYPNPPALFLEDAAWVTPDGKQNPVNGHGVLIAESAGIKTVTFHDGVRDAAKLGTK